MKTEIYKHIEVLVNRYPVLNSVKDEIVEAYFLLVESYKNEGKLLIAETLVIFGQNLCNDG